LISVTENSLTRHVNFHIWIATCYVSGKFNVIGTCGPAGGHFAEESRVLLLTLVVSLASQEIRHIYENRNLNTVFTATGHRSLS
jgi:hypothetical protein